MKIETKLVGVSFLPAGLWRNFCRAVEAAPNETKKTCRVVAQPTNEFDPYAVQLLWKGDHVGHLPKQVARRVSGLLLSGLVPRQLKLEVLRSPQDPENPGIEISFAIGLPTAADAFKDAV